jgi:glycosyltransferase involved in cell wall biosynthesis
MEISVVIPSYKPGDYLKECLASLSKQTLLRSKFEVLLILNGCNQPYNDELQKYIAQELSTLNVRFMQTDVAGVSNARNIGLDNATGDYICFLDDDDALSPNCLAELLLKSSKDVVSINNAVFFTDDLCKTAPYHLTERFNKILKLGKCTLLNSRSFFSVCYCKLIHKDIIGARRFNLKYKFGEDALFMALISDRIRRIVPTSSSALYYRRIRKGSAVTTERSRRAIWKNNVDLFFEFIRIFLSNPLRYNSLFFTTRLLAVTRECFRSGWFSRFIAR